jgi:hypothetical protein
MALSWNEIKDRSLKFSKNWEGESRERAEKDSFWNDFFHVFGISRRRLASFEEPVKKLGNKQGFIDLFWKGTLLVEHKSKGKDLDAAFEQATDYFHGIQEHDLPKYILVSDFERFKLYDLEEKTEHSFLLSEFHQNIKLFGFVAGYQKRTFKEQDPVNIKAAEMMGKLHDELEKSGYTGHSLEVFLVRLLFCLFADDTGIFEKDTFRELIENRTNEDGSDLGLWLAQFFQTLNTPRENRQTSLDQQLTVFPYVNGKLFEEFLPIAAFNSTMRTMLLECSALDWGKISPAIFGSMFQSVMNPVERRNLGAHYTSEKNIMKLIKPLFLDELYEEFEKTKNNKKKLQEFHQKLATLTFLDPACGCGNFLIITYRELRLLELEVLKILYGQQMAFSVVDIIKVDVDQFFGIEYDEFAARIAEVALWLIDHQMNLKISEEFGQYFARLPLKKSAKILNTNALQTDWKELINPKKLSFILGNPPFYGKQLQTKEQKEDMVLTFKGVKGAGVLDYVSAWYLKAADYIQKTEIKVAFVSTNSISQGEQVGILWNELLNKYHIKIHFAHRTFSWSNEARGNAAVHVVIIGFAVIDAKTKFIYDYEDIKGEPHETPAKNINPYLVDAADIVVLKRNKQISNMSPMNFGNMANDGGNLIIEDEQLNDFLIKEPKAEKFIKPLIGSVEFINNKKRWCLWLNNIQPNELKEMPEVMKRVEKVKQHRLSSSRLATKKLAQYSTLFAEIRQPTTDYLIIPRVSSENRYFVPIGFVSKNIILTDRCSFIPNANLYIFGVMTSTLHMTWLKYTCGRLKSDYNYSINIVYNNFPFPKTVSEKQKKRVEEKAQVVLDVRASFEGSSLADLYDPLTMPPALVKAHQALDKAVDLCYRSQAFANETGRVAFLFDLYNDYTAPLFKEEKKKKKKK